MDPTSPRPSFARAGLAAGAALAVSTTAGAQLAFQDVAPQLGVDVATYGRGAAMVDVDGDGRLDLIAANDGTDNTFHRQTASGDFELANADWSVPSDEGPTWGVVAADYDDDGDVDVLFFNGGFIAPTANQLLRNDVGATGGFADVSHLGDVAGKRRTFGGSALDVDADGRLDLFLSNADSDPQLLLNQGSMTFADESTAYGVPALSRGRHTGAGDYDNDGWVDVAAGSGDASNLLLHNDGGLQVTDLAQSAGVASPGKNFGFVFHDFDADGWLDVYLPKYQLEPTGPSRLYINAADGTFTDVTAGSGMTGQDDMGHAVFDLDSDGLGEIYIGTGNPAFLALDLLYGVAPDGLGGLAVTDLSASSGIQSLGPTRNHGMAFGDYDADGDVDVYVNLGGPEYLPASVEDNVLWRNAGNDNGWVDVELEGRLSNRGGIGARVAAFTPGGHAAHVQAMAGMGFGNTPSPILHLGLGAETAVDRVEVRWPSGVVQTVAAPSAFTRLALAETGIAGGAEDDLVSIRAAGPPGDVVQLAYSPNAAAIPFPPLGVVALGPPIFTLPPFGLDAGGTAALEVPYPPGSAAGATLYVQAWIHPPTPALDGTLSEPIELVFE